LNSKKPLFVYGTLCSNGTQHGLVQHLSVVEAKTQGSLYHLPAGYPALKLGGEGWVYGELLSTPDASLLRVLDFYEGTHQGVYQRVATEVLVGLVRHEAWTYAMKHPERRKGQIIPGGRWRRASWK